MTPTADSGLARKKRILKNTAANGVAQAATIVSTFVFLPLLVASFGVSTYGVLVLATSISGYALLLDLGVGAALIRLVADRSARDDGPGVARAIGSAASIYGLLGLAVAGIMATLGLFAGSVFNVTADEAALLRTLLWIGAAQQLWYWPTAAARDALAGLQRYDLISATTLGVVLADVAGTIYVLVSGEGPIVLLLVRVTATLVASLVNVVLLVRRLPASARTLSASRDDGRSILKTGSSVFILQIAQVMSRQQTDKLVLGVFLGTAAVALYEIASKLSSLVNTLIGLASSAVLPVAAGLHAQAQHDTLRSLFLRGTKLIATLLPPVIVVLVVIAGPFILAWFGPGYEEAVPVAQVLLLSLVLLPLYQLGDQVLIGKDKFHLWVPGGLTLAVLNVVVSVALVQRLGLIGVAIGTLIAVLLEFPWYASVLGKQLDLPLSEWLKATAWPSYPLLFLPALVALAGARTGLGDTLLGLAFVAGAAILVYWVVVAFTGYSRDERAELMSLIVRTPQEGSR